MDISTDVDKISPDVDEISPDVDCFFYKICVSEDSQKQALLKWHKMRKRALCIRDSSIRNDENMYMKKMYRPPIGTVIHKQRSSFFVNIDA